MNHREFSLFARRLCIPLAAVLFPLASLLPAQYAVTWGPAGSNPPAGGAGTWSTSVANWTPDNGVTYQAWPGTSGTNAIFSGTGGTVTLGGAISTGGITFNASGYTVAGNGNTLTLINDINGFAPKISVPNAGQTATINAPIAGTNGMIVGGLGSLVLGGANSWSGGDFNISRATVTVMSANGSLAPSLRVFLGSGVGDGGTGGGGTLVFDNTGATGATSQVFGTLFLWSGDGTVRSVRAAGSTQSVALTFDGQNRSAGATANYVVSGGTNGTDNKINLLSPASGFVNTGSFFNGSSYAWKDSGGFLRAINYGTPTGGDTNAVTTSGTTSITGTHIQATGNVTAQATATFTTLKLSGSPNFTLAAGATVTVNGILKGDGGTSVLSGGTSIRPGSNAEMIIRADSATDFLTINTPIVANGSNSLTKSGAGTLTLGGANTYTGSTYLAGGVLSVATFPAASSVASPLGTGTGSGAAIVFSGGGTLQYTGPTVATTRKITSLAGGGTIDVATAGTTLSLNSAITGANDGLVADSLVKTGAGTLSLGGNADNNGLSWVVNGGTLVLAKGNINGHATGNLFINEGGKVQFNGTASDQIYDGGSVTVNGTAGGAGSGILDFNGKSEGFDGLMGGGIVTNNHATTNSTMTLGTNNLATSVTFSGVISNGTSGKTLAVIKSNQGTQIFTGTNTYTGGTTLAGGTLQIGNGGTTGSIVGNVSTSTDTTLAFNRSDDFTFSGSISGTGNLTKLGGGNLTLGVANSFSGATTIAAGTLTLGHTDALQNSTVAVGGGGALSFGSLTAVSLGGITGSGSIVNNLSGGLTLGGSSVDGAFSGIISGSGSLTKVGFGTLTLSGANSYQGNTTVTSGTLALSGSGTLGNPGPTNTLTVSGGTLALNGVTLTGGALVVSGGAIENGTLAPSSLDAQSGAISANLTGNTLAVTKTGPDTLTLSGTNSYHGDTIVNGGVLGLASAGALPTFGNVQLNGGILEIGNNGRTDYTLGGGANELKWTGSGGFSATGGDKVIAINLGAQLTWGAGGFVPDGSILMLSSPSSSGITKFTNPINLGSSARTVQVGFGSGVSDAELSGVLSGTGGSLVKNGDGWLELSGANTYTGGTTLNAGLIYVGNNSAFGTGVLTLAGGSVGSDDIARTIGNDVYFLAGASPAVQIGGIAGFTLNGVLRGDANTGFAKTGPNTLTLNGDNTYTGTTSLQQGVLVVGHDHALGGSILGLAGGTLQGANGPRSLTNNVTLSASSTINGSSALGFTGLLTNSGTFTLTNNDSGGLTLGNVNLSNNNTGRTLTLGGTGNTVVSGVVANGGSSAGGLTKSGAGTLTLNGANTYTGTTTLSAGTLVIGNNNAFGPTSGAGTLALGSGTLQGDGTAHALSNNVTFTGTGVTIAGSSDLSFGTLTNIQGGNPTLTISNTGSTTFTSLALANSGSTSRTVTLSTGTGANAFITGAITNGGSSTAGVLTKTGAGTLTLSGNNSYGGATNVSAGTLVAGANNALGTNGGNTTVTSGATLAFQGGITYATAETVLLSGPGASGRNGALDNLAGNNSFAGPITLSAASQIGAASGTQLTLSGVIGGANTNLLTFGGAGTTVLSGANNYSGGTKISSGTVVVSGSGTLGATSGALNLAGGTLDLATNASVGAYNTTVSGSGTILSDKATASSAGITHTLGTLSIGAQTLTVGTGANVASNSTYGLTFGATTLSADGATFNVGNNGTGTGTLTLGALSGAFNFTKQGAGTLALNTASSRTGGQTTLSAGTLKLGNTAALGTTGATLALNGGTLDLATDTSVNAYNTVVGSSATILSDKATAASAGITHTLGTLSIGGSTLTVGGGNNLAASSPYGLAFGTTTLTGNPTFSVGTNGTLTLGALADGSVARTITKEGTGTLTLAAGTSSLVAGTAVNANAGTLALGANSTLGALNGSAGAVALGANTLTVGDTTNLSSSFGGTISGTSADALIKNGTGNFTLAGANSYTGATTVNAGTLKLGSAGAGVNGPLGTTAGDTTVATGAALDLNGFSLVTAESLAVSGPGVSSGGALVNSSGTGVTFGGAVTIGSGGATFGGVGNITLTAPLAGNANALVKVGGNTLTLAADSGRTGAATVNAGTLRLLSGAALGTNAVGLTFAGGGLALASDSNTTFGPYATTVSANATIASDRVTAGATSTTQTLGTLSIGAQTLTIARGANLTGAGVGGVTFGATTLTGNATFNPGANTLLTLGDIGESGGAQSLTKIGAGTLNLAGTNTYSGGTNLDGGTIVFASLASLPATGALDFGGGTLKFASGNAADISVRTLTFDTGGGTIDTNGNNVAFANPIGNGGAGGFTKAGAGTLTFTSGSANSYTGPATLGGGVVALADPVTLGGTGALRFDGGALQVTGNGVSSARDVALLAGGGTFDVAGDVLTWSGAIANASGVASTSLTKAGNGILLLTGANTYSGPTFVNFGTLQLGSASALSPNTTLQIGAAGHFDPGSFASQLQVSGLEVQPTTGNSVSFTGTIAGGGGVNLSGGGTLVLTPPTATTNSYTGPTVISNGTVQLGSSGALSPTTTVQLSTQGALDLNHNDTTVATLAGTGGTVMLGDANLTIAQTGGGTSTFTGTLTGSGEVTVTGSGNLVLGGTNTGFTGPIAVTGGGQLTLSGSAPNSVITVIGGTLSGSGSAGGLVLGSGGRIAPGNSPGAAPYGFVTLGSSGATGGFEWEINNFGPLGAAGGGANGGWDLLIATTSLEITATVADPFRVFITSLNLANATGNAVNFDTTQSYTFNFVDAASFIGAPFSADLFTLDTSGFLNPFTGSWSIVQNGTDLDLHYTGGAPLAVPEPATSAALAGLGALALAAWRRRSASRRAA